MVAPPMLAVATAALFVLCADAKPMTCGASESACPKDWQPNPDASNEACSEHTKCSKGDQDRDTCCIKMACTANKVWSDCGTCGATCDNPDPICPQVCTAGCFCPTDSKGMPMFYDAAKEKCISLSSCPLAEGDACKGGGIETPKFNTSHLCPAGTSCEPSGDAVIGGEVLYTCQRDISCKDGEEDTSDPCEPKMCFDGKFQQVWVDCQRDMLGEESCEGKWIAAKPGTCCDTCEATTTVGPGTVTPGPKCPATTEQLCEHGRIKDTETGCDTDYCAEPKSGRCVCGLPELACQDMACSSADDCDCNGSEMCMPAGNTLPAECDGNDSCVWEKECEPGPTEVPEPLCEEGTSKVVSRMTMCQGHPTKQEVVTIESCDCEEVDGGKLDWICMSASMLPDDEYCCDKANTGETFANGKCIAPPDCLDRNAEWSTCGTACPAVCGSDDVMICTHQCVEGCFCREGFRFESGEKGAKCVAFDNGKCAPPPCPSVTEQFCEHGRIKDTETGCDTDECAEPKTPTEVPEPLCEEGTSKVVSSMTMCKGHPTKEEEVNTEWCDCENLDWVCMAAGMLPDDDYCCDVTHGETFENGECVAAERPEDCPSTNGTRADGKVWNTCGSPCGDMTCSQKEPMPCPAVCEPRCACHENTPRWDESLMKCVAEEDCSAPPICTAGESKDVSRTTMCQGHPTKQEVVTIKSCDCEEVDGGKLDWRCWSANMLPEDEYCCDKAKTGETFDNGTCVAPLADCSGGQARKSCKKIKSPNGKKGACSWGGKKNGCANKKNFVDKKKKGDRR